MAGSRTARLAAAVGVVVGLAVTSIAAAPPLAAATAARDAHRFACPPGLATPFADVAGTTHADAVACAVHYGLTGGTGPTTFSPELPVSRGQMATFVARLLGADGPGGVEPPSAGFVDTAGDAHEASVDTLVALGIAGGTSPTTFSPQAPVSRAQMATFLHATVELLGISVPTELPDAFPDDEGDVHEAAIDAAAVLGIAGGTADGTYRPRDAVTRGAMATFLVRVVDLGIEHGVLPPRVRVEAFAALAGPAGDGSAVLYTTDVPGVLCFEIHLRLDRPAVGARLSVGEGPGASVALPAPHADGFTGGCVSTPHAAAFAGDIEGSRLEVAGADGVLTRGALGRRAAGAIADLAAIQVVPGPGDRNALGIALVFTTTQPGVLCASVGFLSQDQVTGIHLHEGAPHTNGPVVADLEPAEQFGVALSCRVAEAAGAFAADPDRFYVDVHTAGFPGGALRGQLETPA